MSACEYIFGFGSIINDVSRVKTRRIDVTIDNNIEVQSGGKYDDAVAASISTVNYIRQWCFKSDTGFTALGLVPASCTRHATSMDERIFGVLFPVTAEELKDFDHREQNYHRVAVPLAQLRILPSFGCAHAQERARALLLDPAFGVDGNATVWTYIPDKVDLPSPEYPILTTYLDVCLIGCLDWGGESLAVEFLRSTHGWPEYHLDDSLCSRRPWLHRRRYEEIDRCLRLCAAHVRWADRLHSEEYAARHLSVLRGTWGLPSRNPLFIGREDALATLHKKLSSGVGSTCSSSGSEGGRVLELQAQTRDAYSGITAAEVIGQAGIGKSSFAAEYCWRNWDKGAQPLVAAETQLQHPEAAESAEPLAGRYGLILWLRAETIATLAEDMRQFASDMGIIKQASATPAATAVTAAVSPSGGGLRANRSSGLLATAVSGSGSTSSAAGVRSNLSSSNLASAGGALGAQGIEDSVVIQEVHRRLSQCKCRWLIVFDNVEDISLLDSYIPRGQQQHHQGSSAAVGDGREVAEYGVDVTDGSGVHLSRSELYSARMSSVRGEFSQCGGSILITTRCKLAPALSQKLRLQCQYSLTLSCFSDKDSTTYLHSFLKDTNSGRGAGAAAADYYRPLAERLGHLPLALSVAAAYMQQCEVSVGQYLRRLDALLTTETQDLLAAQTGADDGGYTIGGGGGAEEAGVGTVSFKTIAYSLSMTLSRIRDQSEVAYRVLCCLSFLYTENLSKQLLQQLLTALIAILKTKRIGNRDQARPAPVAAQQPVGDGCSSKSKPLSLCNDDSTTGAVHQGSDMVGPAAQSVRDIVGHAFAVSITTSFVLVVVFNSLFTHYGVRCSGSQAEHLDSPEKVAGVLGVLAGGAAGVCSFAIHVSTLGRPRLRNRREIEVQTSVEAVTATHLPAVGPTQDLSTDIKLASPLSLESLSELDVEIECDKIWLLLKQFSVLVTDDSSGSGFAGATGSIHRLQQAVIRIICRGEDVLCYQACVETLCGQWAYSLHDARTWAHCADLLPHIEALCAHLVVRLRGQKLASAVAEGDSIPAKAVLRLVGVLTDCGCYAATSSSQFVVAQKLLHTASTLYLHAAKVEDSSNSGADADAFATMRTDILHTAGKVFRYQGELENADCALSLALQLKHERFISALAEAGVKVGAGGSPVLGELRPALVVAELLEGTVSGLDGGTAVSNFGPLLCSISNTLHELGVLYSRLRKGTASKVLFRVALVLKSACRKYGGLGSSAPTSAVAHALSVDALGEASTYHQLGVAAINDRNYEEAEKFLYRALLLEFHCADDFDPAPAATSLSLGDCADSYCFDGIVQMIDAHNTEGSLKLNMVAKAATLQQFGRLLLRRGQLQGSRLLLEHSLRMFEHVYGVSGSGGKDVAHINLAAIRHQLGAVTLALGQLEDAEEHAAGALGIRESIFQYEFNNKYGLGLGLGLVGDGIDVAALGTDHLNAAGVGGAMLFYSTINARLEILQELQLLGQVHSARHDRSVSGETRLTQQGQVKLHAEAAITQFCRLRSAAKRLLAQFELHRDWNAAATTSVGATTTHVTVPSAGRTAGFGAGLSDLWSDVFSAHEVAAFAASVDALQTHGSGPLPVAADAGTGGSYYSKQQVWVEDSLYKYWQYAVEQLVALYGSMLDSSESKPESTADTSMRLGNECSLPVSPDKWCRLSLSDPQHSLMTLRHRDFYSVECAQVKLHLAAARRSRVQRGAKGGAGGEAISTGLGGKLTADTAARGVPLVTRSLDAAGGRMLKQRVVLLHALRERLRVVARSLQKGAKAFAKGDVSYADALFGETSDQLKCLAAAANGACGYSEGSGATAADGPLPQQLEAAFRDHVQRFDDLSLVQFVTFIRCIEDKKYVSPDASACGHKCPSDSDIVYVLDLVSSASGPNTVEPSREDVQRMNMAMCSILRLVCNASKDLGNSTLQTPPEPVAISNLTKSTVASIYQLTDSIRLQCCELA